MNSNLLKSPICYMLASWLLLGFTGIALAEEPGNTQYEVEFSANFIPGLGVAFASLKVRQSSHLLRVLDLNANAAIYQQFEGDGDIKREGNRLIWNIPETGGVLRYQVLINHKRGSTFDAQMTEDWAILRLDQLFPPARVRSKRGSSSVSFLSLRGPEKWRFESRYFDREGRVAVEDPDRKFDRPTGWLAAGKLGIRRETIANRKVTVAAPLGQGMRRMDILALLRWTLPKLVSVFPHFPERLLIVGADTNMWRGGLSGPGSVFFHSDRPLISENATSTLIHELVHTATSLSATEKEDWIVEGVAEYYSLELLRRSGSISKRRFGKAVEQLESWAERENGRLKTPSSGADTARAVLIFDAIQRELASHETGSLDSIVRKLMSSDAINGTQLVELTESALGGTFEALRMDIQKYGSDGG